MKKLVTILTILLLFTSACVDVFGDDTTYVEGTLLYKVMDNGEVEIVGYYGKSEDVEIPTYIAGHVVTAIGDHAFQGTAAKNISLPETITDVGTDAFPNSATYTVHDSNDDKKAIDDASSYADDNQQKEDDVAQDGKDNEEVKPVEKVDLVKGENNVVEGDTSSGNTSTTTDKDTTNNTDETTSEDNPKTIGEVISEIFNIFTNEKEEASNEEVTTDSETISNDGTVEEVDVDVDIEDEEETVEETGNSVLKTVGIVVVSIIGVGAIIYALIRFKVIHR